MKILILLSACVLLLSGCLNSKPQEVQDPCKNAPTICFGNAGESPNDRPNCQQVTVCYDWELHIQR